MHCALQFQQRLSSLTPFSLPLHQWAFFFVSLTPPCLSLSSCGRRQCPRKQTRCNDNNTSKQSGFTGFCLWAQSEQEENIKEKSESVFRQAGTLGFYGLGKLPQRRSWCTCRGAGRRDEWKHTCIRGLHVCWQTKRR